MNDDEPDEFDDEGATCDPSKVETPATVEEAIEYLRGIPMGYEDFTNPAAARLYRDRCVDLLVANLTRPPVPPAGEEAR